MQNWLQRIKQLYNNTLCNHFGCCQFALNYGHNLKGANLNMILILTFFQKSITFCDRIPISTGSSTGVEKPASSESH